MEYSLERALAYPLNKCAGVQNKTWANANTHDTNTRHIWACGCSSFDIDLPIQHTLYSVQCAAVNTICTILCGLRLCAVRSGISHPTQAGQKGGNGAERGGAGRVRKKLSASGGKFVKDGN